MQLTFSLVSQVGIDKLIRILEGKDEDQFKADEYMQLYT